MEIQNGDEKPLKFSYTNTANLSVQKPCYITYTNDKVHQILKQGFEESPMYTGRIQGLGPRYCPSIEDKINRFAERDRHQIFVEPEGWDTVEIYVNGFSTSLPQNIQEKAIKLIPGFENVKLFRPGYAIEYDYFPPTQLNATLETKLFQNLYFAGQINGTTGYEEAACQGLMAGINAHLKNTNQEALILNRNEAYIGVLIDDLINKGTDEPYRMFTSRAEYRILLRQDNADSRLTPIGYKIGLASEERMKRLTSKEENTKKIIDFFNKKSITPAEINPYLSNIQSSEIDQQQKFINILSRPQVNIETLKNINSNILEEILIYDDETLTVAEILIKYNSYILKEKETASKLLKYENLIIKENIQYDLVNNLSSEGREKLKKINPKTIGQASRISGVSPADISLLIVYLGK